MAAASPARLAVGLVIAAAVVSIPAPATAAPKPDESRLRTELKNLNTRVDGLIEKYNLKRVELAEARKASQAATERLATAEQALAVAEKRVAEIVQMGYQGGGASLPTFMLPLTGVGSAVLEQLITEQQAVVNSVTAIRDEKKKAADETAALAAQIRADTAAVEGQRDEAQDVIKDIEKKLQDLVPVSSGRRSDGSWAPQLPSGDDHITPRTRAMRELIKKNFALPFTVGCFRSGSSGEHPLGRACDFMLSSGGTMPATVNQVLGDRIAAWAVENKAKLGVKYVIWKQRINHGSGWNPMGDRGSITENHFDHVHISMY
ncbi:coiled-coil domain-containing protein [Nonomuraea lactucae]|uniref:coiled-coil domain-containing protein n=1 Tax=Nonomuraea lactucae TaxID=2249762 RepID=UPI000DE51A3D|nr:hypothetical protein [Nonomuraea lactucae]